MHPTTRAVEEASAKIVLEPDDLPAQRGLRDVEMLRRAREAERLTDGEELSETVKIKLGRHMTEVLWIVAEFGL